MKQSGVRVPLGKCRRIVVKVGSALLAQGGNRYIGRLVRQISALKHSGKDVLLVSSGAIALGLEVLELSRRPTRLGQLQAAAAAGQPELLHRWAVAFRRQDIKVGQVLLTHSDFRSRERFLNTRHAVAELLKRKVVPIINENDSVATEEIRVGDNDRLSAFVSGLVDADLLILLTTVDGVYTADPERNKAQAKRIKTVDRPSDVAAFAGKAGRSGLGVGGMATKIQAAQAAVAQGAYVVIASGRKPNVLERIIEGDETGTVFRPASKVRSRKHWIGFTLKSQGTLIVDRGAAKALVGSGRSLLPSGLSQVQGHFDRGAMVEIKGPDGIVARGLAAYSANELKQLAGHKSSEIVSILGYMDTPEIVHRDDMVIIFQEPRK